MRERFRPITNTPPSSFLGWVKFYGRMTLDLQILTIYRDLKQTVPTYRGNILDVGCGQSPYRFLLDPKGTKYFGLDIADASKFDYSNSEVTPFNGRDIPFPDSMFDGIVCTEVLEHVLDYRRLVDEMRRVLKTGGQAIVTIPWSARYHYIPYDYFRYTPSSLESIFSGFADVRIDSRGSDVSNIANKLIVMWSRNLFPDKGWEWLLVPAWVVLVPVPMVVVVLAHLALWLDLGSKDDPLGYTILVTKRE